MRKSLITFLTIAGLTLAGCTQEYKPIQNQTKPKADNRANYTNWILTPEANWEPDIEYSTKETEWIKTSVRNKKGETYYISELIPKTKKPKPIPKTYTYSGKD